MSENTTEESFSADFSRNERKNAHGGHTSALSGDGSASVLHRGKKSTNAARRLRAGVAVILIALLVLLLAPSPYAIEMPGPTENVLGKVSAGSKQKMIEIKGVKTYKNTGQLRLVTVSAMGVPGYPAPTAAAVWAWFHPSMAVMPQEAVYSVDQDAQDYEQQGNSQMMTAQDTASAVATSYAAKNLGINTSKAKISLHVEDIGGPSAGMIYTLGTIVSLTKTDELAGKVIAGTGTMEKSGKVGAIGGIRLKMIGAKRDGATYFLAPTENCDEVVGHIPQGLRVVAVSNIDEAYKTVVSIGKGETAGLPVCEASHE